MEDWEDQNTDMDFSVGCKDAGCMGHETFGGNYGTPEQAAAAWNRRTPQTVAVIAPAIEWEGMNHRGNKGYNFSKCKDYRIVNRNGKFVAYKWGKEDALYDGNSEPEAIAACQIHKQSQVDKALEGCNVRPWVDPQGLVEAIKTARPKIIKLLQRFGTMDAERDPLTELDAAIKAWEESK